MPIKPENKRLYPPPSVWRKIRQMILERANHACEFCLVKNYAYGYRDEKGCFSDVTYFWSSATKERFIEEGKPLPVRIILTIAHLDHNPRNNDPTNLRALCQKCHNDWDREHRLANASRTRLAKKMKQKGQILLDLSRVNN